MNAPSQVRVAAFRERYMKCASCNSDARWMIFGPSDTGSAGTTSCERHRALWERRKGDISPSLPIGAPSSSLPDGHPIGRSGD